MKFEITSDTKGHELLNTLFSTVTDIEQKGKFYSFTKQDNEFLRDKILSLRSYFELPEVACEHSFIDDMDKMYDFLELSMDEFLKSYSYLNIHEYTRTLVEFSKNVAESLANLMRTAENMHLDEMNGRDTGFNISSDELKTQVETYAKENLSKAKYQEYQDICTDLAC